MSQNTQSTSKTNLTRRTMLAGTAATLGVAATGITLGLSSAANAATSSASTLGHAPGSALCQAHHQELSSHLSKILNSAYVDERMKNKVLSTSHCPHCKVAIAPEMKIRAAFAALA